MLSKQLELLINKLGEEYKKANEYHDKQYFYAMSGICSMVFTNISTEMINLPDAISFSNYIGQSAFRYLGRESQIPSNYLHNLKHADYFGDKSKTFLSEACGAILDNKFDINSCQNYKILESVMNINLIKVSFAWKTRYHDPKYNKDIMEYNQLVSKYGFQFEPINVESHYCKFHTYFYKNDDGLKPIIVWIRNKAIEYAPLFSTITPTDTKQVPNAINNQKPVIANTSKEPQTPINIQNLDALTVIGLKDLCTKLNIPIKSNMKRQELINLLLKKK